MKSCSKDPVKKFKDWSYHFKRCKILITKTCYVIIHTLLFLYFIKKPVVLKLMKHCSTSYIYIDKVHIPRAPGDTSEISV